MTVPAVVVATRTVTFLVAGHPVTQGSKVAGVNPHNGQAFMRESAGSRLTQWRHAINTEGRRQWPSPPTVGPVRVELVFWVRRPQKPRHVLPVTRGLDVDKAARAALDALTGVCWLDDAQVVDLTVTKRYAAGQFGPGVSVTVTEVVA